MKLQAGSGGASVSKEGMNVPVGNSGMVPRSQKLRLPLGHFGILGLPD